MVITKKNKKRNLTIGLALGGGGARGIAHIEVLKLLDELHIKPSYISGTSIGAIIGAMYSSGMSGIEIEIMFKEMKLKDFMKLFDVSWNSKTGFFKGDAAIKKLETMINCTSFEELKIPLDIVATDFWEKKTFIFKKGDLLKAIKASFAIPAIFEPVLHNRRVYVDGGVSDPLPYDILQKKTDIVIAVDVLSGKKSRYKSKKPTIRESTINFFEIMQVSLISKMLLLNPPDIYYCPTISDVDILEFNKAKKVFRASKSEIIKLRKLIMNSSALRDEIK